MVECPDCGKSISEDVSFCTHCGRKNPTQKKAVLECPDCGKPVSQSATFCPSCDRKHPAQVTVYGVAERMGIPWWVVPILVVLALMLGAQLFG